MIQVFQRYLGPVGPLVLVEVLTVFSAMLCISVVIKFSFNKKTPKPFNITVFLTSKLLSFCVFVIYIFIMGIFTLHHRRQHLC